MVKSGELEAKWAEVLKLMRVAAPPPEPKIGQRAVEQDRQLRALATEVEALLTDRKGDASAKPRDDNAPS